MSDLISNMTFSGILSGRSDFDFSVILDGLMAHPQAYVNFGKHWWTLKRMIADWVEENGAGVDPALIRGTQNPPDALDVDESEVYRFLDQFSGRDDFMDWIAYVNPMTVWDESDVEDSILEDPEWEENFL